MSGMSAPAVTARLRRAAEQSRLRSAVRLHAKLDLTPGGVARRLAKVESLRRLCLELGRIGARAGLARSCNAGRG